jgi:hypothetical protein
VAVRTARQGRGYEPGSAIAFVTWSQRDDPHWFGGRIPKGLVSVEVLSFGAGGTPGYALYEGASLTKKTPAADEVARRVQYIAAQKASVLPKP